MYKLSYYRFGDMSLGGNPGTDRARGYEIGNKDIELTYLEEAYTSEHWIVRIYRVRWVSACLPPRSIVTS